MEDFKKNLNLKVWQVIYSDIILWFSAEIEMNSRTICYYSKYFLTSLAGMIVGRKIGIEMNITYLITYCTLTKPLGGIYVYFS